MGDWDVGLQIIEEEDKEVDKEVDDSYLPNYTSDHSYVNITPSDGQFADAPRLTHSTNGWDLSLQAMEEEDEEALGSDWSNVTEPELELANDSSYIQDCYPPNSYNPDIPQLIYSTSGPNITLEATGEEDEEAVGSYLPNNSELDLERVSEMSESRQLHEFMKYRSIMLVTPRLCDDGVILRMMYDQHDHDLWHDHALSCYIA
ncbi:hypothetical protein FRC08_014643 [Ceratobasidium sp. 394]|nr:hypothetical protein FRC08_014643 [Ceratobasidium sp. 394]